MNEFGLIRTSDGRWGVRRVNDQSFAIQYRSNPQDPWDWEVLEHRPSEPKAITRMKELASIDPDDYK